MKQDDIPLFPVAAISVGPVPAMGIVVIRPDFLTNLMQRPEEAQQGRTYALTPAQARYLVEKIQSALRTLESAGSPTGIGPRH